MSGTGIDQFLTSPELSYRLWIPLSLLYDRQRRPFPEGKAAGTWC